MLQWPAAAGRASTLSNSPMRLGERVRGRCTVGRRRAGGQRAVVGGGGAKGVNGGKASDERGTRRACLWQILSMGTLGGGMGNAPMQHQDSLGGASVGR